MPFDPNRTSALSEVSSQLDRRKVLAYAGAAAVAGGVVSLMRPDIARAAVQLAEAAQGVDTVDEARAAAAVNAWGGYANGQIPAAALAAVPASVAGSGYLRTDAARQYSALNTAFRAAIGRSLSITEGYRSYDRQVDYWNRYQAGTGNLAAYPGTSNHGWGISCDFGAGVDSAGSAAKRWMDANAPSYGWSPTGNTFSRPEPWHFDYVLAYQPPSVVTPPLQNVAGLIAMRVPEAMPGVGTSYTCLMGQRFLRHYTTIDQVNAFRTIGVPYFDPISRAHFELLVDVLGIPRSAVVTGANYWRR